MISVYAHLLMIHESCQNSFIWFLLQQLFFLPTLMIVSWLFNFNNLLYFHYVNIKIFLCLYSMHDRIVMCPAIFQNRHVHVSCRICAACLCLYITDINLYIRNKRKTCILQIISIL